MATTCLAPSRMALRIAIWPTGPQPQIATVSVGWMSHWTAACQPVGKMSPRKRTCSSGRAVRNLDVRCVGKRNANVFRLTARIAAGQVRVAEQASRGVAEDLVGEVLLAVRPFADGEVSALALLTLAADDRERHDDPVA